MDTPSRYRRTTDEAPGSLKIVAYLFTFSAGLSVWGMVVLPFFGKGVHIDLSVFLWVGTALGLLLAINGWRIFVIVMSILSGLGVMFFMGLTGYDLAIGAAGCDWWVFGEKAVTVVHILKLLGMLPLLALEVWVLWVLFSRPVRDWFRKPLHFRVAMTRRSKNRLVLSGCLALPLVLAIGLAPDFKKPADRGLSTASEEKSLHVSYGYRYGRLAYVVFQEKPFGESMWSLVRHTFPPTEARLVTPGGEEIRLPNRTQLYEIVEGKLGTSPKRVTGADFEAFLEFRSERYTIDALLSFVDALNKEPETPVSGQE